MHERQPRTNDITKEYYQSIALADKERRRLKRRSINPEHLLLGVLAQSTGSAAQTLAALAVDFDTASVEIEKLLGSDQGSAPIQYPFNRKTADVLGRSETIALGLMDGHVGTKHILIALIDDALETEPQSKVAQIFKVFGIDMRALRIKAVNGANSETPSSLSVYDICSGWCLA